MKSRLLLLAVLLACGMATRLAAQQLIPLDEITMNRLGLVFMRVTVADSNSGTRFPATVIASPATMADLHALHGGILERWLVQAGQQVSAGEALAVVRSPQLLELQQQWVSAQAAAQQAAYALERDEQLLAEGIIAAQRLQETQRQARDARFTLQALQAALAQAGFTAQELQALQDGTGEPGRYLVKAPADGVVARLGYRAGEQVGEGEPVVSVTGGKLWISAELPASLAARIQQGQQLRLADHEATLLVMQKDLAMDAGTQTVGVLAEFVDEATTLLPGQVVSLLLPPQADGIVVPADAVVHNGGETSVYVRAAAGVESRTLVLQPVGTDYLATSGLADGDEVVVRGAALIKGITLGLGGE